MTNPISFYFDYISPYAYLGWRQILTLAAEHGRAVEPVPILFAALLNHHGHKGPAEIPPKRVYIFKNVLRIAHRLGVPLQPPPSHPFNPLLALRVTALVEDAQAQRRLIDGLFTATWGAGAGVTDPYLVGAIADQAGLDGAALVRAAGGEEAKARVRQSTERALALGVFGVPTFVVDGELFWGCDALPDVEAFLRGEDPVSAALLARWADLPASAGRR